MMIENKYERYKDYNYDSLNILKSNMDISIYNNILNYLDPYLYKYLWNSIVSKWNNIRSNMNKDKKFNGSKYSKFKYNYEHSLISQEELNNKLKLFIDNDIFKSIIIISTIEDIF